MLNPSPSNILVGLSPMDGVTDAAYRFIHKKYGDPDFLTTEFVHVMGICRGSERLFQDFIFSELERPILAQVYGSDPEYFYHAAKVVAALGFDGIDINMGCPARGVVYRGGGAALISTPELAKNIITKTRKGVTDYFQDRQITGVTPKVVNLIENHKQSLPEEFDRMQQQSNFTITVKTRIGYNKDVAGDWMKHLTEVEPNWISLHGRTLKQMYSGGADWDSIARAVESTHIPVIGNGDIDSSADAVAKIKQSGVSGVLIGRGSYGNPWIFRQKDQIKQLKDSIQDYSPTITEILAVMKEHAQLHIQIKGEKSFNQLRKNFAWYIKGFPGAASYRSRLVRLSSLAELDMAISEIKNLEIS